VGAIPWAAVHALERHHVIRAEWRANAHWYELTHDRLIGPIRASNRRFTLGQLTGVHEEERAVPVVMKRTKAREWLPGRHREAPTVSGGEAEPEEEEVERSGTALCLTGGGYRSMFFTAGVLWRFNEAGLLPRLQQISSNSGAAVTSALLALNWERLEFGESGRSAQFEQLVLTPLRELADSTLDVKAVWSSVLQRRTGADGLADEYERRLFGQAQLGELPESPQFVFTSSHLASGELWRFSKHWMGNARAGWIKEPETKLAVAVAASGANPPLLSPAVLDEDGARSVILTAGTLYDTLALETAWRRFGTVLVSDGKGSRPLAHLQRKRLSHFMDFVSASDTELQRLRRQQALLAYTTGLKKGGYWSIASRLWSFPVEQTLDCPPEATARLAALPGRLSRLDRDLQEQLVNWGFAVTDAALRAHFDPRIAPSRAFPYPSAGVGAGA
jgi:NTE family protein